MYEDTNRSRLEDSLELFERILSRVSDVPVTIVLTKTDLLNDIVKGNEAKLIQFLGKQPPNDIKDRCSAVKDEYFNKYKSIAAKVNVSNVKLEEFSAFEDKQNVVKL